MPGEKGFLSLLVVLLVAGTAVYLPYSGPTSSSTLRPSTPVATQDAAASKQDDSQKKDDTTEAALITRVARTYADGASLIAQHFGLPETLDPMWLMDADATVRAGFMPRGVNSDTLQYPKISERLAALSQSADFSAEFLIATVPDPIDSNARWQFDPIYDSIQAAISTSGYSLDRFYIPDWDTTRGAADMSLGLIHERLPGVVLFRKQIGEQTHFLVVFLAFETATSGIHALGLRRAIWMAADWSYWQCRRSGARCDSAEIRILGPTFSGSIVSLGNAINAVTTHFGQPLTYRIVSGSATGAHNQSLIGRVAAAGIPPGRLRGLTYRTTVLSDGDLFPVLDRYLSTHLSTDRTAILLEDNTAYGRDLRDVLCPDTRACRYDLLPFPLHISRLRNTLDGAAVQSPTTPSLPGRNVPLLLKEGATPRDQLPSVEPALTASSIDVTLDQILGTIEREHVSLIGLFATDARDKLFLAQQVSLRSPDALIFTIDGDLLFMHPDYLRYTRGMIVASSYPLFTGTQLWSPIVTGNGARHQFPSSNAEGVYNAAVALLQYLPNGVAADRANRTPLIDYRASSPSGAGAGPYAWISTVGRNGIWPLREDLPASCTQCGPYIAASSTSSLDDSPTHPSGMMTTLLAVMQFFIGWYAFRRWFHPRERAGDRGVDIIVLQALAYAALLAMEGFAILLLKTYDQQLMMYSGPELPATRIVTTVVMSAAIVLSCVLVGTAIDDLVIKSRTRRLPQVSFGSRKLEWSAKPYWVVPTAATAILLVGLPANPLSTSQLLGNEPLLTLNRSFQLFNGVSPSVPLLIVLLTAFAWAEFQLMRATTPLMGMQLADSRLVRLDALATGGLVTLTLAANNDGERSALFRRPIASIVTFLLTAAGFALLVWIAHVQTAEKTAFDVAFLAGWYVLQALVCVAFVDHYMLWRDLRALLKGLAVHPLAPAFKRVPTELFSSRLGPRRPRLVHLQHAINAGLGAGKNMNQLQTQLDRDLATPHLDVAQSGAWEQLLLEVSRVTSPIAEPSQPFASLPVALLIRDFGARVVRGIYLVFGGLFALVLYQMSVRAYPRGIMLGVTWFYVVVGIGLALETVITAERNTVLSYLAGTEPGKIQWDSVFITRTVLPLLFALFTLFAMQFPGAGGALLGWLRPMQTAIP